MSGIQLSSNTPEAKMGVATLVAQMVRSFGLTADFSTHDSFLRQALTAANGQPVTWEGGVFRMGEAHGGSGGEQGGIDGRGEEGAGAGEGEAGEGKGAGEGEGEGAGAGVNNEEQPGAPEGEPGAPSGEGSGGPPGGAPFEGGEG